MKPIELDLHGKVALVTGAGKGSGRAIAQTLAERGARLAVNDITPINLDETEAILRASGGEVKSYVLDVAKKMPIQGLVNQVVADFGGLDIVVHCAEVKPLASVFEMDDWDWQRTLDVNLTSAMLLMQAAGRAMQTHGGGVILVVAPPLQTDARQVAYTVSKVGLVELCLQADDELKENNISLYLLDPAYPYSMEEQLLRHLKKAQGGRMEELLEYRARLIAKLADSPQELKTTLQALPDAFTPLQTDGWNAHQVLVHMRDVNQQVYLPRLARILAEDDPQFENFDGEAWMASHYRAEEPLKDLLADFEQGCQSAAERLKGLQADAWNRPGSHPSLGKHALQWWLERTLAHIREHLEQLNPKGA